MCRMPSVMVSEKQGRGVIEGKPLFLSLPGGDVLRWYYVRGALVIDRPTPRAVQLENARAGGKGGPADAL